MIEQLQKIFFLGKVKKALVILGFSTIIIAFYLGSFFIAKDLFRTAAESFSFYKAAGRRGPCVANSFTFLLEMFSQNRTILIGPA